LEELNDRNVRMAFREFGLKNKKSIGFRALR
jgi:hypothetical protein